MAVVYVLTTRSTVRNPYTTYLDSSSVGHHAGFMSHSLPGDAAASQVGEYELEVLLVVARPRRARVPISREGRVQRWPAWVRPSQRDGNGRIVAPVMSGDSG